jgi:hypothetical protein
MVLILDDEHSERLQRLADECGEDPEQVFAEIMDERDRLTAVLRKYAEVIARWSVEDMMRREQRSRERNGENRKSYTG